MARYLPIALASLVLSASFVFPAFGHRASARVTTGADRPSVSVGSRAKPDRPTLTKEHQGSGEVSCMIWEQAGDGAAMDYTFFSGSSEGLAQTLSELRSWHPASVWGCD